MISLLDSPILKSWFSKASEANPFVDCNIYTIGNDPFVEADFDAFIRAGGLEVYPISKETDILVVGHSDFDREQIKDLLDLRERQSLRVYSQEMFLAHWMTGQDPFENRKIVESFAEDHDGLEFLISCWVDWASTNVSLRGGGDLIIDAPKTGILKELGYTVGKTKGLSASERHRILETVFTSNLYKIISPQYIKKCEIDFPDYFTEWGEPKSKQRLTKMRDFISSMCRKQKYMGNLEAATDYEEDLEWLEICYRTGRFKYRLYKAHVG